MDQKNTACNETLAEQLQAWRARAVEAENENRILGEQLLALRERGKGAEAEKNIAELIATEEDTEAFEANARAEREAMKAVIAEKESAEATTAASAGKEGSKGDALRASWEETVANACTTLLDELKHSGKSTETQAAKAEKLTKQQKNVRRRERQLAAKKEKEAKEEQENCALEKAARTAEAERVMIAEEVVAELEAQGSSASHAWHRTFVCPQCDDEIENDFAFTCASALVFGWCRECTHVTVDLGAAQQRDDEV